MTETLEDLNLSDNYLSRLVGVGAPGERSSRQARHSARSSGAARLRTLNVARNLLAGALDSHSLLVVFAPTLVCLNLAGKLPCFHFLSHSFVGCALIQPPRAYEYCTSRRMSYTPSLIELF